MIRPFKGNLARMILDERRIPKGFPTSFAKIARGKLIQLNNADLKRLPLRRLTQLCAGYLRPRSHFSPSSVV